MKKSATRSNTGSLIGRLNRVKEFCERVVAQWTSKRKRIGGKLQLTVIIESDVNYYLYAHHILF